MGLDLLHVHKRCAHFLCHGNAVAGSAGMVGGAEAGQVCLVLYYHIGIGTKAAGSQNHGSTVNVHLIAVLVRSLDAAYGTLVIQQYLFGLCLQKHRNAQLLCLCIKGLHQHGTYGRRIAGSVNPLYAGAAEHAYHA